MSTFFTTPEISLLAVADDPDGLVVVVLADDWLDGVAVDEDLSVAVEDWLDWLDELWPIEDWPDGLLELDWAIAPVAISKPAADAPMMSLFMHSPPGG
ncbi:MAG TPA: hypothetical protein VKB92_12370 [Myxococcales bacterium]|nr:hypothetical protein [Myxococcales bacterium]